MLSHRFILSNHVQIEKDIWFIGILEKNICLHSQVKAKLITLVNILNLICKSALLLFNLLLDDIIWVRLHLIQIAPLKTLNLFLIIATIIALHDLGLLVEKLALNLKYSGSNYLKNLLIKNGNILLQKLR